MVVVASVPENSMRSIRCPHMQKRRAVQNWRGMPIATGRCASGKIFLVDAESRYYNCGIGEDAQISVYPPERRREYILPAMTLPIANATSQKFVASGWPPLPDVIVANKINYIARLRVQMDVKTQNPIHFITDLESQQSTKLVMEVTTSPSYHSALDQQVIETHT